MSLIQDALKASQREKDRRAPGGHPPAPLIVPLRSKPKPQFSWRNALTIGVSSAVIVGSAWVLYVRLAGPSSPALRVAVPAPPEAAVPAPTQPSDAATRAPAPATARTAEAPPPPATKKASDSTKRVVSAVHAATRPAPAARRDTAPAILQGQTPAETTRGTATQPAGGGRLRISVEQPRGFEAANLFAIGVAAHRAGDLDAARNAYERVLLISPNDVDALNNLGVLLGAQREFDRAEQVLRRVVRLAPRNAGAWNNLGTVLAQRARPGEALAAFQQALQIDPMNSSARVSVAQQHLAIGSPVRAKELLEEAIAGNPSLAEAHYTLGQACELQKDWACAIRAYNAFIRVAPSRMAADVERVRKRVEMLGERVK